MRGAGTLVLGLELGGSGARVAVDVRQRCARRAGCAGVFVGDGQRAREAGAESARQQRGAVAAAVHGALCTY